ncbi:MAG: hypothetical protein ACRDGD_00270 [Candidatus Limnocylindria bacterium]
MTDADQRGEPCTGCGRPTRSGTTLFSDRRTARDDDGRAIFLCGDCNERAVSHYGRRLTVQDMRKIATRAAGPLYFS